MSPLPALRRRGPENHQLRFDLPTTPADRIRDVLADSRYQLLGGALLFLVVSFFRRQQWGVGTDIWEHAAAARQLGANPLHPGHPLLSIDEPHQFYSPYALVLGIASRLTGLSIVTVLSLVGVVNLVLLMTGLWLLLTRLLNRKDVALWAVLFVLLLWGPNAWNFSGFLHLKALPFVLPYPATFSMGLMLFGLWAYLGFLQTERRRPLAAVGVVFWVVLLTHPVDAITLAIGIAALTLAGPPERLRTNLTLGGATLVLGFVAACFWPYFNFLDLLFGASNEAYRDALRADDHLMYQSVLGRVWPMLVVLPFVVRRALYGDRRDALTLWFAGLLLAYGYGWWSQNWAYGRLIAALMLVGAMILADERSLAARIAAALGVVGRPALRWVQVSTLALLGVGLFYGRNGFAVLPPKLVDALPSGWVRNEIELADLSEYSFLPRFVGEGPVVLADGFTALEAPAFGAKMLAVPRPEAFVDTSQRSADLNRFFDKGTSVADRRAILSKYRASYLLLRNSALATEPDKYGPLLRLGSLAHRNQRFTLLDVRSVRPVPGS